jgi:hypothetical protein
MLPPMYDYSILFTYFADYSKLTFALANKNQWTNRLGSLNLSDLYQQISDLLEPREPDPFASEVLDAWNK